MFCNTQNCAKAYSADPDYQTLYYLPLHLRHSGTLLLQNKYVSVTEQLLGVSSFFYFCTDAENYLCYGAVTVPVTATQ